MVVKRRRARPWRAVMVMAVEADVADAAEGFPLRQQFAELRVQLLQANPRHVREFLSRCLSSAEPRRCRRINVTLVPGPFRTGSM